jgi:hypothetical protein
VTAPLFFGLIDIVYAGADEGPVFLRVSATAGAKLPENVFKLKKRAIFLGNYQ